MLFLPIVFNRGALTRSKNTARAQCILPRCHQYVVFTRVTQKLSRKPRSHDQLRPPNTSWCTSMEMSQRQLATCNCRCNISAGQLVKTGPCGAPSSSDAERKELLRKRLSKVTGRLIGMLKTYGGGDG